MYSHSQAKAPKGGAAGIPPVPDIPSGLLPPKKKRKVGLYMPAAI
jgi:hypothetical protein